jgi:hypothetical protein
VTAALERKATFDELGDLLDEVLAETRGVMTTVERKRASKSFPWRLPIPATYEGSMERAARHRVEPAAP